MSVSHKEQQVEYRRLKRERTERLAREDVERCTRISGLRLQSRVDVSHDEMLELLRDRYLIDADTIICSQPVEGGWTFVVTKYAA